MTIENFANRGEQELKPWAQNSLFSIDGQFPKLDVAGSSPVSRSIFFNQLQPNSLSSVPK